MEYYFLRPVEFQAELLNIAEPRLSECVIEQDSSDGKSFPAIFSHFF